MTAMNLRNLKTIFMTAVETRHLQRRRRRRRRWQRQWPRRRGGVLAREMSAPFPALFSSPVLFRLLDRSLPRSFTTRLYEL